MDNNSNSTEKMTNEELLENKETQSTEATSTVGKTDNEKKEVTTTTNSETENKTEETNTENKSESSDEAEVVKAEVDESEVFNLTHIDKDFMYDLMSVPSVSDEEYRMVTYIILWARRNNVKYEFDEKGNVYLTKGELAEGEYYPCVTAHLDTVQTKQKGYAQVGCRLDVKTRYIKSTKTHEIYVEKMGIGGDDKAGILIGLSLFNHVDKLKACFFLCEERGCLGSKELNTEWFKNVGYVMGYDSPELNRAAYACSGVRLFSKDFFLTYMKDVCAEHGLTKFHSEPYTDVKEIRLKTDIMCMNFGSGYYNCHMSNEYCVVEEMDNACRMGEALIKKIGNTRHEYSFKSASTAWTRNEKGVYVRPEEDKDEEFFRSLSGVSYGGYGSRYTSAYDDWDDYGGWNGSQYGGYGRYSGGTSYGGGTSGSTSTTNTTTATNSSTTSTSTNKKDDDTVSTEVLKYVTEKYDEHIEDIKNKLKAKCEKLGVSFDEVKEIFDTKIKF